VIELVGVEATLLRARDVLDGIGMKPLIVRKEIDAHIADRFLEAVWREALWLVKDGIATTEEIDDASATALACAGRRWVCSRPTASPAARPECVTSSPSSARASAGPGPS
jgi:hypothetical protein